MSVSSVLDLTPSQLGTFLREAIPAREPVCIVGEPGIGKTDIIEQACAAIGSRLVPSFPAVSDPTDGKGMPFPGEDGIAHFQPFGELADVLASTSLTTWFWDDLGQATPATQASFMPWLLGRRCGEHTLPDDVTIIAATNDRTHRANVSGMLEPVKSRFSTIVYLRVDLDDWCQWAFNHAMPAELIAFLRFRPDLLSAFDPTLDLTNSPSPRTWANAGRLLGLTLDDAIMATVLAGAVGSSASTEFDAFRRLYRTLPSIDAIILDPDSAPIPDKPSTLYAVTTALGMRANVQVIGRLARYAERMMDAGHGEFAALLIRDANRRDSEIANTTDFIRLLSGELGKLIGGAR